MDRKQILKLAYDYKMSKTINRPIAHLAFVNAIRVARHWPGLPGKTIAYQLPDGSLIRDREKAENAWKEEMLNENRK